MSNSLGAQPLEDLVRTLRDGKWERASTALSELALRAHGGDRGAISSLIEGLNRCSPDTSPQAAAEWEYIVEALERVGTAAVDALMVTLSDRSRPTPVRTGAARALGNIGDARAVHTMVQTLTSEEESTDVRVTAAFYVGRLHDRRASSPLLVIAGSTAESPQLRRNALYALGELRDPDTFEGLMALLDDAAVRRFASQALTELQDVRGLTRLLPELGSTDEERRFAAAAIVGALGEAAFEPLRDLLSSPDPLRREGAAVALGFGHSRALEALVDCMLHDPDAGVRAAAAYSVGYIGGEEVIGPLLEGLGDEEVRVRLAAVSGLASLAIADRLPVDLLPRMEWMAEHDLGTIEGHPAVREVAGRVARNLRLRLVEHP